MCKYVVTEPFYRLTLRSKNATLFFHDSYVNIRFGKKLLSPSKFCFSMRPNKKDIINISQQYKWLKLLSFKKICLSFVHINTGVWRSKFSSNSRDMLLNFVAKFKKLLLRTNSAKLTRSLYLYLRRQVFRPSQDSSLWLQLTSREQLMSLECLKNQVLSFSKVYRHTHTHTHTHTHARAHTSYNGGNDDNLYF